MKRVAPLLAGFVLAASVLVSQASAPSAHADIPTTENAFVSAVNAVRASRGVAPLAVDVRLTNLARSWAGQMGAAGRLADNPNLAAQMPAGWSMIGENVGEGPNWAVIESALEHDAPHLANMVQPGFNAIGVGVAMVGSQMWMAEEFMAGVPIQSPIPPRPPVVWTGWHLDGAPPAGIIGAPAVSTWGVGRFDQLARGRDGQLWHRGSTNGGASYFPWEALGAPPGGLASSPAAVSWGAGRIDVFVVGADRALWQIAWQNGWFGWQKLGGVLTSAPAVSSWGPNRLDVFAAGNDRSLWHMAWAGDRWVGWDSRGGRVLFDPAATSWAFNRIDLFAVGTDHTLWHSWYDGRSWSAWGREVPGNWSTGPAAASWPGRVDVLIPSTAGGQPLAHWVHTNSWNGEWLGGVVTAGPAIAAWAPNRVDAFVRGADGNLYHDAYPGG